MGTNHEAQSNASESATIDELLEEGRVFTPSEQFRVSAAVQDSELFARAAADPEAYWAEWASQLDWYEPWEKVLEWDPPDAKWFVGGKLNACYNCVDRHVKNGLRNIPIDYHIPYSNPINHDCFIPVQMLFWENLE